MFTISFCSENELRSTALTCDALNLSPLQITATISHRGTVTAQGIGTEASCPCSPALMLLLLR